MNKGSLIFFSINESADNTASRLLRKTNDLESLINYRGSSMHKELIVRERTPQEQKDYELSKKYEKMAEELRRKSKTKKDHSLIGKIMGIIVKFVFVIPLTIIIFLGATLFVGTIFLGLFVGMVSALINMLLKGNTEALINFLKEVKKLIYRATQERNK